MGKTKKHNCCHPCFSYSTPDYPMTVNHSECIHHSMLLLMQWLKGIMLSVGMAKAPTLLFPPVLSTPATCFSCPSYFGCPGHLGACRIGHRDEDGPAGQGSGIGGALLPHAHKRQSTYSRKGGHLWPQVAVEALEMGASVADSMEQPQKDILVAWSVA